MTWFGSGKDQIEYYVQANQAAVLDAGSDNRWIFIYYIKKKKGVVCLQLTQTFSHLSPVLIFFVLMSWNKKADSVARNKRMPLMCHLPQITPRVFILAGTSSH